MTYKSVKPRDGGYCRLVEAVLSQYVDDIKSPRSRKQARHTSIGLTKSDKSKLRKLWLEEQLRWVEEDNYWFNAYEEAFNINADKVKDGMVELIKEQLRTLEL